MYNFKFSLDGQGDLCPLLIDLFYFNFSNFDHSVSGRDVTVDMSIEKQPVLLQSPSTPGTANNRHYKTKIFLMLLLCLFRVLLRELCQIFPGDFHIFCEFL